MRKFSYKAPGVQASVPVQLSVEEEAIAIDESNQTEHEIEEESADIDQLGDIIVTMGDVQTVVSNTPEIQPIDQALVSAVADMAVAGTDANPEELVTDVLPNNGVSAEGFIDTVSAKLKEIWKKIKELISKAWENIKQFFGFNKTKLQEAEKKLEKAKEQYAEVQKALEEDPVIQAYVERDGITRAGDHVITKQQVEEAKARQEPQQPPEAKKPKQPRPPRRIDFWGTAGNLSIDGKLVEPEKLAGEIRRLTDAVEKGVSKMHAGWPQLYDNVKHSAESMHRSLNGQQSQETYDSFMKTYKEGGAKQSQIYDKIVQYGGFQREGSEKHMLADFALLYTSKDSHSSNWNDFDLWVDMAGNGYNNVRADGIREIPLDNLPEVFAAVDAAFDVIRKLEKDMGSDMSMNSHRKAVEDAMNRLSESKPTAQDIKNEPDALKGLSMSVLTGAVQQMGFSVFNMAKIGQAMAKATLVLTKVADTACMYAERSLRPASE